MLIEAFQQQGYREDKCNKFNYKLFKIVFYITMCHPHLKQLDLRGAKTDPGYFAKRRHSHAGRENPRTPAPSLHSSTIAHVRRPMAWAGL